MERQNTARGLKGNQNLKENKQTKLSFPDNLFQAAILNFYRTLAISGNTRVTGNF